MPRRRGTHRSGPMTRGVSLRDMMGSGARPPLLHSWVSTVSSPALRIVLKMQNFAAIGESVDRSAFENDRGAASESMISERPASFLWHSIQPDLTPVDAPQVASSLKGLHLRQDDGDELGASRHESSSQEEWSLGIMG